MNDIREAPRYAIYARTAAGGPDAVEAQIEQARAAINDEGGTTTIYRDVNVSGVGRPGPALAALLADLKAGAIDHLVVTDWARLGRAPARIDEIRVVAERAGCRITTAEEGR